MSDELFPDHNGNSTTPLNPWDLPPASVYQNGEIKLWSLDERDLPPQARGRINTREWPNEPSTCELKDVLEHQVDRRFFISPKACGAILRRAEVRGKTIPEALADALRNGARYG